MKKIILLLIITSLLSCKTEKNKETTVPEKFTFSTWTLANKSFKEAVWQKKINYYDSLGISEILVGASPKVLEKIIKVANQKKIKVHGWMWTMNRPGDTIAQKHPEWYAVNKKGKNSLEYRAYVDYYQWLSPFHPEARKHIINNAKKLMNVEGLASIHLDYVRYPDVILGADLQPKYNLVQETEMPEYDYDYHPLARKGFKEIFDKDPIDFKHPELSTEWRQYRLNAISSLVNEIIDFAHAKNKKVTAAVFPFPEMSRQMVRQAWNDWNLDTAYPMLYQNFYKENINWIGFATKQGVSDVDFPIISGLYTPALRNSKDLEEAIKQAKENGAKGISIFTADDLTTAQKAVLVKLKNKRNL
ncbi:MAG: family 10 glycosylhydrolase [Polaribacter sp.]|uniref:family 10 glycosylhydrolase n=1 Tax=Polaribacter sp. TaxID=1920175 RepID=UPI002F35E2F0